MNGFTIRVHISALLSRPVFDFQAFGALELALVIGNEDEFFGQRVGGDPQIVAADDISGIGECAANVAICVRNFGWQCEDAQRLNKLFNAIDTKAGSVVLTAP